MKIAVIGGNGRVGSLVVKEALNRGHDVTAIIRSEKKYRENTKIIVKDLFDLVYDDIKDFDVIIDAFASWEEEKVELHQTSLKHLSDILSGKPNRLLVVGGAGSLYLDSEHKVKLIDAPEFPKAFRPVAENMSKAYDALKKRDDVNWTYLSPAADFIPNGIRTGKYKEGGDELIVSSKGESEISFADYAIAMLDEVEQNKHPQQRFTVVWE